MQNFFIPGIPSREEAEQLYQDLLTELGARGPGPESPRLYQVAFHHDGQVCVARVGERIRIHPDAGVVLAITESSGLVLVHASTRLGRDAIHLHSVEVVEREYFDDFPEPSADQI